MIIDSTNRFAIPLLSWRARSSWRLIGWKLFDGARSASISYCCRLRFHFELGLSYWGSSSLSSAYFRSKCNTPYRHSAAPLGICEPTCLSPTLALIAQPDTSPASCVRIYYYSWHKSQWSSISSCPQTAIALASWNPRSPLCCLLPHLESGTPEVASWHRVC